MEARLLIAKVVWEFDLVGGGGGGGRGGGGGVEARGGGGVEARGGGGRGRGVQAREEVDLERKLRHYGFLVKPEVKIRFLARCGTKG